MNGNACAMHAVDNGEMTGPDFVLEQAYLRTTYVADDRSGPIPLRIGEPSTRLDDLLRETACTCWAFISAWNPASQRLSEVENAARHAALLARVRELGLPFRSGRGVADDGGWVEESLLILGLSAVDAIRLGRAFGQNTVVVGCRGGLAELKWCLT